MRFDERKSKNHKVDLKHCQPKKMRRPVTCCHTNVVETFETYMSHLPKWDESDLPRPHPFFLRPIDGNLKEPGVWYAKARVGLKQVAK